MKSYFIILNDRIELMYQGKLFNFDLNDGDREDYWGSFTYNGKELDINYYPVLDSLTIYNVHDETGQIDTSIFEPAYFIGDFTYKYIIVDVTESYLSDDYMKRYTDTKEIIIFNSFDEAYQSSNPSKNNIPLISNLGKATLIKIFTEKIKEYEKTDARRSA